MMLQRALTKMPGEFGPRRAQLLPLLPGLPAWSLKTSPRRLLHLARQRGAADWARGLLGKRQQHRGAAQTRRILDWFLAKTLRDDLAPKRVQVLLAGRHWA
ncbi:unnamed protein product [Effrenium voratum]|uniref:Uncharacterized protein n=1 Tax=Effrenium voratum TaxID=2562239 RepID=A0AA36I364_9DINO|nr:unnamed protein product [Effrenium voratum]CAJ1421052.1 unnamed protein product [Effrenium voratum]